MKQASLSLFLAYLFAVAIGKFAANYHNEVDYRADAEAAHGEQPQNAGAGFADIEAMNSETADEKADEQRSEPILVGSIGIAYRSFGIRSEISRNAAFKADIRIRCKLSAAISAILAAGAGGAAAAQANCLISVHFFSTSFAIHMVPSFFSFVLHLYRCKIIIALT